MDLSCYLYKGCCQLFLSAENAAKLLRSCCEVAVKSGNVGLGFTICMLSFSHLFPEFLVGVLQLCSMVVPRATFPQQLRVFAWRILWPIKKASCEAPSVIS
jgi:hypothetical protein